MNASVTIRQPGAGLSRNARRRRNRRENVATIIPQQRNASNMNNTGTQQTQGGRRRNRRSRRPVSRANVLSDCARDYLQCLEDPFESPPCCVPSSMVMPSQKVKFENSSFLVTSATTNFGYVIFRPFYGPFVDLNTVIWTSASTYAVNTISNNLPTTGLSGVSLNGLYTSSLAGTLAKYKLVSAGLRVRYAGSELNRGGSIVAIEEPSHGSTNGFSYSTFKSYPNENSFSVITGEWTTVVFHPIDEDETDWYTGGGYPTANDFLAIAVVAPSTTSITFEWEAVANFELVGVNARGVTPSISDPVGFAKVANVASAVPQVRQATQGNRIDKISKTLNTVSNTVQLANQIRPVLTNIISGIGRLMS